VITAAASFTVRKGWRRQEVVFVVREVVVIGAGIVGVALARELAARDGIRVTVLERDAGDPRGSTAFAPGFVGLYNDAPVLTELARASASVYERAGPGFARAGGLELATSDEGAEEAERRAGAARAAGLPARMLRAGALPGPVARFVDAGQVTAAACFPEDGVAVPAVLTAVLREQAEGNGARFLPGQDVTGIGHEAGAVVVTTASGGRFAADDVVLAGGVWGPSLAGLTGLDLPLFPVAHPYAYSAADPRLSPGHFVRWPEHHVYARVHDDRLGIGSYDHAPVPVSQAGLADGAGLAWTGDFDPVISSAQRLLHADARFRPEIRVNGVFAMTPDNLPFLGPHPALGGVWIAQAIWITHAAGAAAALAGALASGSPLPGELAVDRFGTHDAASLRMAALRLYRDIYANDAG
jgi:glycine/D-amino acid oxidase-like deaminating enzyme